MTKTDKVRLIADGTEAVRTPINRAQSTKKQPSPKTLTHLTAPAILSLAPITKQHISTLTTNPTPTTNRQNPSHANIKQRTAQPMTHYFIKDGGCQIANSVMNRALCIIRLVRAVFFNVKSF
jgi:hypothetical protein